MKSFCWDSKNKDRRYYADDWARYFAQFISNGVYAFTATNMQVQANGGRTVKIAVGSCFIKGRAGYAEGDDVLTLDFGGGGPRIDRIVARLDVPNREIQPYVIKGEVADTPIAPDIIRDGTYFDLCLAEIKVSANATEITQADITDVRGNNEVCGWVKGLIEQMDTTELFAQIYQAWYDFAAQLGESDHVTINTADETARTRLTSLEENVHDRHSKLPTEIVVGVYTGDGADSQQIDLGFRPAAVIASSGYGAFAGNSAAYGGMFAIDGYSGGNGSNVYLEINDSGFLAMGTINNTRRYHYVAFSHYPVEV